MLSFVITLIYNPEILKTAPTVVDLFVWFFVLGPVALTLFHVRNYKTTISSMSRLISLYMQVVMMFGCIHFYSSATYVVNQVREKEVTQDVAPVIQSATDVPVGEPLFEYKESIKGIGGNWITMLVSRQYEKKEVVLWALKSFYNSLHFSLVTSTTVGYGDMYPVSFKAKVMVDIQIIVSFFLIAFGAGSFFSKRDEERRAPRQNNQDTH